MEQGNEPGSLRPVIASRYDGGRGRSALVEPDRRCRSRKLAQDVVGDRRPGGTVTTGTVPRASRARRSHTRVQGQLQPTRWDRIFLSFPTTTSPTRALADVLGAFASGGLLRFGLRTLLRGPAVVVSLLAVLLVPWTVLLAVVDNHRWFPHPGLKWAWGCIRRLVGKRAARSSISLAGPSSAPAHGRHRRGRNVDGHRGRLMECQPRDRGCRQTRPLGHRHRPGHSVRGCRACQREALGSWRPPRRLTNALTPGGSAGDSSRRRIAHQAPFPFERRTAAFTHAAYRSCLPPRSSEDEGMNGGTRRPDALADGPMAYLGREAIPAARRARPQWTGV